MNTTPRPLRGLAKTWIKLGPRFLPFADAATVELPLGRLLRLSLFQISVGMAAVLLTGTLNRVMIVELGVPSWLVAAMVSLPLVFAPFRAFVGFKSDTHRSVLGWKRVPYLWFGTLLQFGGLAIMPFALILLSGEGNGPAWIADAGAALAFLLVGAGMHTTQTAGLALAADLASDEKRPRVVALLYVMLLVGMVGSSLMFGVLLATFAPMKLIQVVQGAAALTMVLNLVALWKQEARDPSRTPLHAPRENFRAAWRAFLRIADAKRFLVTVGLGTAAFSMQDVLLEPYGGEILHLSVGSTTTLTALIAIGTLVAFAVAARALGRGADPLRLAAVGALLGVVAFSCVIVSAPTDSAMLFRVGALLIGIGGGAFSVGTLTYAMQLDAHGARGLALGAWGAVQASAAGSAIAISGALRDAVSTLATQGALGSALAMPSTGYSVVYHLEIGLLFATLVAIGPLVRSVHAHPTRSPSQSSQFGLAEFPG